MNNPVNGSGKVHEYGMQGVFFIGFDEALHNSQLASVVEAV